MEGSKPPMEGSREGIEGSCRGQVDGALLRARPQPVHGIGGVEKLYESTIHNPQSTTQLQSQTPRVTAGAGLGRQEGEARGGFSGFSGVWGGMMHR